MGGNRRSIIAPLRLRMCGIVGFEFRFERLQRRRLIVIGDLDPCSSR